MDALQEGGKNDLSAEVAIMLKLASITSGSVEESAPVSLLDWYDLDQELILILERPVPCKDLSHYIMANGGYLKEQESKVSCHFDMFCFQCSPHHYIAFTIAVCLLNSRLWPLLDSSNLSFRSY